jgi:hypothetical protein
MRKDNVFCGESKKRFRILSGSSRKHCGSTFGARLVAVRRAAMLAARQKQRSNKISLSAHIFLKSAQKSCIFEPICVFL